METGGTAKPATGLSILKKKQTRPVALPGGGRLLGEPTLLSKPVSSMSSKTDRALSDLIFSLSGLRITSRKELLKAERGLNAILKQ